MLCSWNSASGIDTCTPWKMWVLCPCQLTAGMEMETWISTPGTDLSMDGLHFYTISSAVQIGDHCSCVGMYNHYSVSRCSV